MWFISWVGKVGKIIDLGYSFMADAKNRNTQVFLAFTFQCGESK